MLQLGLDLARVSVFAVMCISISCKPKSSEDLLHLGIEEFNRGQTEEARKHFLLACEHNSDYGCAFAEELTTRDVWFSNDPYYLKLRENCIARGGANCRADFLLNLAGETTRKYPHPKFVTLTSHDGVEKLKEIAGEMTKLDLGKVLGSKLAAFSILIDIEADQDLKRISKPIFFESAKRGDLDSMNAYASSVEIVNPHTAHGFYEKAALLGHIRSMLPTARDFLTGKGISQNKIKGLAWLSVCSSRGDKSCTIFFKEYQKSGSFKGKDDEIEAAASKIEERILKKSSQGKTIQCTPERCDWN